MEVFKAKALRQGSFNAQRSLEPNLEIYSNLVREFPSLCRQISMDCDLGACC